MDRIPQLPNAHLRGDSEATNELFAQIYDELKTIAHQHLARHRSDQTVNTTALVHEVYLKLTDRDHDTWVDKAHFLAIAATAMRHILVDYARKKQAQKRGAGAYHTSLDASALIAEDATVYMLDLDKALSQLEALDARLSQVVLLRFFGGLTVDEAAHVLGVSTRTIRRDWFRARNHLHLMLHEEKGE